jgi:hypothetical protein
MAAVGQRYLLLLLLLLKCFGIVMQLFGGGDNIAFPYDLTSVPAFATVGLKNLSGQLTGTRRSLKLRTRSNFARL